MKILVLVIAVVAMTLGANMLYQSLVIEFHGDGPKDAAYHVVSMLKRVSGSKKAGGLWEKFKGNPVLSDHGNTYFDVSVLPSDTELVMFYSWRNLDGIAMARSRDGFQFDGRTLILPGSKGQRWDRVINRPHVLKHNDEYYMWFTGQNSDSSMIGFAKSKDLVNWTKQDLPVLVPSQKWEGKNVMCPSVVYDDARHVFRMWYSGGELFEPNAIGYAESPDGITWTKQDAAVFVANPSAFWERERVTAGNVWIENGYVYLLYVGFSERHSANIGIARSRNGLDHWERYPGNPVLVAGKWKDFDRSAIYKPFRVQFKGRNIVYFNGRRGAVECIGAASGSWDGSW